MPPMSADAPAAQEYKRLTQHDLDIICAKHDRLWSAKMGGARAVFTFCDLSGLSLTGRNLCDADFTGAIMVGCDLRKTKLDNANLYGADLQGAALTDASLRRADLRGSSLRGANLTGADMFEADLREGAIAAADRKEGYKVIELTQREAYAIGANLSGANLERSRLSGIVATKADFSDAILKDAKLVRANLKQANFNGANLAGADLSGANLAGGHHHLRPALRADDRRPCALDRDRRRRGQALGVRQGGPAQPALGARLQPDGLVGEGRGVLRPRHGRRADAGRPARGGGPSGLQPAPGRPPRRAAEGRQADGLGLARRAAGAAAGQRRPRGALRHDRRDPGQRRSRARRSPPGAAGWRRSLARPFHWRPDARCRRDGRYPAGRARPGRRDLTTVKKTRQSVADLTVRCSRPDTVPPIHRDHHREHRYERRAKRGWAASPEPSRARYDRNGAREIRYRQAGRPPGLPSL